jgi:hypothetical protein
VFTFPTDLAELLDEINGQDCYDRKVTAVGALAKKDYLKLPRGFVPAKVEVEDVGKKGCVSNYTTTMWAQVYALNKDVFEPGETAIKGAMLRADLVGAGWIEGKYEVTESDPIDEAELIKVMTADKEAIKEHQAKSKMLAYLLPLAAEHTFRIMGHHYISSLASDYDAKYSRFFAACVLPELTNFLPPPVLYHQVAHWVSLSKSLQVAKSPAHATRLPNAVVLRSSAGPAGTAILTTSGAILNELGQYGLKEAIIKASKVDADLISEVAEKVKASPAKYHAICEAYDQTPLSGAEKKELDKAKEAAILIAPVLQGFIDSLPRSSDLHQAKALIKHAEMNPLLRRRAKVFFKDVKSTKAERGEGA